MKNSEIIILKILKNYEEFSYQGRFIIIMIFARHGIQRKMLSMWKT